MSEFSSDKNYYEILGLKEDCSSDEIRKSYKRLALKWHPDKNIDNKEEAEKKFKEISEAYSVLSDVSKRKEYDDFKKYGKMGASFNGFSSNDHPGNYKSNFNFNFDHFDARNVFKEFFGGKDPFTDFGKFGFDFDDDFGNFNNSFQNDDFFKGMGTSNFMFNNNGSSFNNKGGNGFQNMDFGRESGFNNVSTKNTGGGKKTSVKKTTQTINGRRVTKIEKTITDENGNTTVEVTEEY